MTKKKISKASKRRLVVFGTISVFIIFYFLFSAGYYTYRIYTLKTQEKNLNNRLTELEKQEKILSTDMEKLKDPEYLAKYAREAYSYSKDDEIIIQSVKKKEIDKQDEIKFSLNDKYILGSCITIICLIIIYIIIKSIKHNKRKKKKGK